MSEDKSQIQNNKRIAKNTIFLYIRMFITVLVSLYTSRVVLDVLGVDDFGIYNVVGGIVVMFSMITNSMASASQRFLAFELSNGSIAQLKKIFNITFTIYLLFALIIAVLGETVGLWFVSNKLSIQPERVNAAIWVYQFSLFSFIITVLRTPFNAAIIVHENMKFYAWISIIETSLKLFTVFMLTWFSIDKLILYSVFTASVILCITFIYIYYCYKKFQETHLKIEWDKKMFGTILSFSGWSLFDSIANVAKNQGVNVLLNIYFGSAINAARGIAFQISSQITAFAGNIQVAAYPQIVKYYAAGEKDKMKNLYFQSSRLSFFLLLIIGLPILFEMTQLLEIWLVDVPLYTSIFARLVIINIFIDSMAGTSNIVAQATGKIKYYQMLSGIAMFLNFPVAYFFLKLGSSPESAFVVSICMSGIVVNIRLYVIQKLLNFSMKEYYIKVVFKNIKVGVFASIIPCIFFYYIEQNIVSFFIISSIAALSALVSVFYFGLTKNEQIKCFSFLYSKFKILKKQ